MMWAPAEHRSGCRTDETNARTSAAPRHGCGARRPVHDHPRRHGERRLRAHPAQPSSCPAQRVEDPANPPMHESVEHRPNIMRPPTMVQTCHLRDAARCDWSGVMRFSWPKPVSTDTQHRRGHFATAMCGPAAGVTCPGGAPHRPGGARTGVVALLLAEFEPRSVVDLGRTLGFRLLWLEDAPDPGVGAARSGT
jgi:hypothetical protein